MSEEPALDLLCRAVADFGPRAVEDPLFLPVLTLRFGGQHVRELHALRYTYVHFPRYLFRDGAIQIFAKPSVSLYEISERVEAFYTPLGMNKAMAHWVMQATAVALGKLKREAMLSENPPPERTGPQTRPCPHCTGQLMDFAIFCDFCGSTLDEELVPAESLIPGGDYPERVVNRLGMVFVLVRPGSFLMGSPPDEPHRCEDELLHPVRLTRPFYLQRTTVTQEQWLQLMDFNYSLHHGIDQPVCKISGNECLEFARRLQACSSGHYRLPTEAEWEYACRAGSTSAYAVGNGERLTLQDANIWTHGDPFVEGQGYARRYRSTRVGSYPPNAWGLYDMHGNVFEFCQDALGPYPADEQIDPIGPRPSTCITRGGYWRWEAQRARSAQRRGQGGSWEERDILAGFRLAWWPA